MVLYPHPEAKIANATTIDTAALCFIVTSFVCAPVSRLASEPVRLLE
jgi:hypothetical protein